MKKKRWIPIIVVVVLAILFVPIPSGAYKDGGTREYTALTYKIVDWNRLTDGNTYDKTKVYFFPYNFKSIDGLWYYEEDDVEYSFNAEILEFKNNSVIVKPIPKENGVGSSDQISFDTSNLPEIDAAVGDYVKVTYRGD